MHSLSKAGRKTEEIESYSIDYCTRAVVRASGTCQMFFNSKRVNRNLYASTAAQLLANVG